MIGALETIGWIVVAAVAAWGLTLAHATSAISRLDTSRRREIQYWKDECARARAHAAQVTQDAAAFAAGNRQGRDEVISIMPLIMAAKESPAGPANGDQDLAGKP